MITNERQYRISKAQLAKFKQAIDSFDIHEAARQTGSKLLAKAEWEALKSEEEILSTQLQEYELLKSGAVTVLKAESLDELPNVLIRARIPRHETPLLALIKAFPCVARAYESMLVTEAQFEFPMYVIDDLGP